MPLSLGRAAPVGLDVRFRFGSRWSCTFEPRTSRVLKHQLTRPHSPTRFAGLQLGRHVGAVQRAVLPAGFRVQSDGVEQGLGQELGVRGQLPRVTGGRLTVNQSRVSFLSGSAASVRVERWCRYCVPDGSAACTGLASVGCVCLQSHGAGRRKSAASSSSSTSRAAACTAAPTAARTSSASSRTMPKCSSGGSRSVRRPLRTFTAFDTALVSACPLHSTRCLVAVCFGSVAV